MSEIHYFQRYSQKENVITNNTLLLFSRLYNQSPYKFNLFLNELTNDLDINVGISFNQQTKGKNSIPDGSITQESFKIAIETKLSEKFSISQLVNHLDSFKNEKYSILLGLSPKKPSNNKIKEIEQKVVNYNAENDTKISFISVTFKDIVFKFNEVINDYDFELQQIIDDFESFCYSVGMIRDDEYRMLTIACGKTLNDNFKNNVYYDPADRGYSSCTYLGIYKNKSVRGIGKIENIISANLNEKGELDIVNATNDNITETQKNNIIEMINDANENLGWNIRENHKFFCVTNFEKTDFRKTSKNGLFGKKYFNLSYVIENIKEKNTIEIAELLKEKDWK